MRLLVAGSRTVSDVELVRTWMNAVWEEFGAIDLVVTGGARGVDKIAESLARKAGVSGIVLYADWDRYGRRAGYVRNAEMLKELEDGDVVLVIMENESRGSKMMLELALGRGGVNVVLVEDGVRRI